MFVSCCCAVRWFTGQHQRAERALLTCGQSAALASSYVHACGDDGDDEQEDPEDDEDRDSGGELGGVGGAVLWV